MFDTEPLLAAGVIVADSYEVERLLGKGGMGEVWLAKHRRVAGKQVALKVLKRAGDIHPDMLARFKREAEIAAKLEHPNIVQVLDYATLPNGSPFLVMELLRGESLAARLKRGPMMLHEVQEMVVQVGSALHVAHAAGVVHRDLKPENIFLLPTPAGDQVKVLDFGISKLVDSRTVQTSDSVLIGTPLYMSPEQARGDNAKISAQSDIFSLASLCFEAITGQAPFNADSVARIVYRVAFDPAPPIKSLVPSVPDNVSAALEHALQKRLEDRTRDIATFVREFTGVSLQTGLVTGPGEGMTDSMIGPTVASAQMPSSRRQGMFGPLATPEPRRRTSTKAIVIAAGILAVGIVALVPIILSALHHGDAAAGDDAGAVVAVTPPDAAPAVVLAPAPDAAVEPPVDAGFAVAGPVDAGRGKVVVRAPVNEKLTADQLEILQRAQAAIETGKWIEAIDWTNKPAVAGTGRAVALRVDAYCRLGNLSAVMANKGRLPAHERARLKPICAANNIDL